MRLAIFGTTGRTGTLLLDQALAAGHTVAAVVRRPPPVATTRTRLTVFPVPDLGDTASLRDALIVADAVLSAIGPSGRGHAPAAAPAVRGILAALPPTTSRIIVTSAAPVGTPAEDDSTLNRRILWSLVSALLRPVYDDLRAMEHELMASGTAWTALRPAKLTNGPFTGRYRTAIGTPSRPAMPSPEPTSPTRCWNASPPRDRTMPRRHRVLTHGRHQYGLGRR